MMHDVESRTLTLNIYYLETEDAHKHSPKLATFRILKYIQFKRYVKHIKQTYLTGLDIMQKCCRG